MQDDPHRDRLFEAPDEPREHQRNRLWLSNGLALSLLLVAVFNPVSLERWAAANPPNWAIEPIRLTVGVWSDRMGLARLVEPSGRVVIGGSRRSRPQAPGYRVREVPVNAMGHPVWLLIMDGT